MEQPTPMLFHLPTTALFQALLYPLPFAFLAADDVTANLFVEQPEAVGQEVADVRKVQERERNSDQRVQNRHQATGRRLRRNMAIPYGSRKAQ